MTVGELKQMLEGICDDVPITADLTNRHWGWTKTPVLEGLYTTSPYGKERAVLQFHEPYWDGADLKEVLP